MLTLGFFPSLFFFVFFLDPGMEPLFSPPLRSWYLLSFFSRPLPQSRQACLRTCVRVDDLKPWSWKTVLTLRPKTGRPTNPRPRFSTRTNHSEYCLADRCQVSDSLLSALAQFSKRGGLSSVFLLSASCFRSVIFVTPFLLFSFYEERKLFVAAVYFFIFWYILLPPFFIAPCLLNRGQTGAWALLLSRNALLLARKTTKFTGH